MTGNVAVRAPEPRFVDKAGAWIDLALTLPIFLAYHLGVVFMKTRNATDWLTDVLLRLADGDRAVYLGITGVLGLAFGTIFALLGRGHAFASRKFVQIALEGVVYAVLMRLGASYAVGQLLAGRVGSAATEGSVFDRVIMSMGAGFYEELAFRVVLFGLGAKFLVWILFRQRVGIEGEVTIPKFTVRGFFVTLGWAIVVAFAFSGFHYVGVYGDEFKMASFLYRAFMGLAFAAIYVCRGFAAAVWTHALYDVWVLVF
ncbi:MAG: CPBP family glutamic-type intramembrane protease [Polyangiaceae bacterium]